MLFIIALGMVVESRAEEAGPKFLIPDSTLSPDRRYGVRVPVFNPDENSSDDQNHLVEVRTGRILAVIRAATGYDRRLNHLETLPSRWSADSSLLLWEVDGKWFPAALVLLKIEKGAAVWQRDLLALAQQEILERTRKAAPEKYAAAKKANAGFGSAYPDGFTVDVEVSDPVSLPLRVKVVLSSDPKINAPSVESHLDAVIDDQGKFKVTDFALGHVASRHF